MPQMMVRTAKTRPEISGWREQLHCRHVQRQIDRLRHPHHDDDAEGKREALRLREQDEHESLHHAGADHHSGPGAGHVQRRQEQRRHQPADSGAGEEQPQLRAADLQHVALEDRDQRHVGRAEDGEERGGRDDDRQAVRVPDVANPFEEGLPRRRRRVAPRGARRKPRRGQEGERREAEGGEESRLDAALLQNESRRPRGDRHHPVEHDREVDHSVRDRWPRHHVGDHRLPHRQRPSRHRAAEQREDQQQHDGHAVEQQDDGHGEDEEDVAHLGPHQDLPPVDPVRHRPADQRQQQNGERPEGEAQRHQERRLGQVLREIGPPQLLDVHRGKGHHRGHPEPTVALVVEGLQASDRLADSGGGHAAGRRPRRPGPAARGRY